MSMTFKKICRLAGNAIVDYHMIEDGDKILVGVSGGKDSMILLKVLKHLSNAAPVRFTLYAATFDPGFAGFSTNGTASYCESLGIPHHVVSLNIPRLLQEKHLTDKPCMLCSRLRRGNLYSLAEKLGCNKIALGQHLDDIEISFLMSICRGSGLSTMGPNVPAEEHALRVIRPLAYTPESLIIQMASEMELPRRGECIYREQLESSGDRAYFRSILEKISEKIPDLRSNLLRSLSNIQEEYLLDRRFIHAANRENPNETD